jgi:hypothetical protein
VGCNATAACEGGGNTLAPDRVLTTTRFSVESTTCGNTTKKALNEHANSTAGNTLYRGLLSKDDGNDDDVGNDEADDDNDDIQMRMMQ